MTTLISPPAELDVHGDFEVDFVDEMRLRTWARRNYAPATQREDDLHPIVLDEMLRKDGEH